MSAETLPLTGEQSGPTPLPSFALLRAVNIFFGLGCKIRSSESNACLFNLIPHQIRHSGPGTFRFASLDLPSEALSPGKTWTPQGSLSGARWPPQPAEFEMRIRRIYGSATAAAEVAHRSQLEPKSLL